jgi:hypothetical protein
MIYRLRFERKAAKYIPFNKLGGLLIVYCMVKNRIIFISVISPSIMNETVVGTADIFRRRSF